MAAFHSPFRLARSDMRILLTHVVDLHSELFVSRHFTISRS
jgi:hypothetical protein